MPRLEKWIREKKILFALDEVQSSFGRTGKMWCMEWENLTPDLVSAGKGIGSGVPQSAILARSEVMNCLKRGDLGSTNGGSPVSCAATLAVFDIMKEENLVERSRTVGEYMLRRFQKIQKKAPHVGDVRGRGLVMGIEIVEDKKTKEPSNKLCQEIVLRCADKGLLVGIVGICSSVIRVGPPLVITDDEVEESLDIMEEVLMSL